MAVIAAHLNEGVILVLTILMQESIKETLNGALIAAHLNAGVIPCSDRYIICLFPHLHTPLPSFSPSLISLVVSVEVKHHVYLLANLGLVAFAVDCVVCRSVSQFLLAIFGGLR